MWPWGGCWHFGLAHRGRLFATSDVQTLRSRFERHAEAERRTWDQAGGVRKIRQRQRPSARGSASKGAGGASATTTASATSGASSARPTTLRWCLGSARLCSQAGRFAHDTASQFCSHPAERAAVSGSGTRPLSGGCASICCAKKPWGASAGAATTAAVIGAAATSLCQGAPSRRR